jgi:hypothetical protein
MAKRRGEAEGTARTNELLRTLTIVQLGLAGVGQIQIQKIVGGTTADINTTVRLLNSGRRRRERQ